MTTVAIGHGANDNDDDNNVIDTLGLYTVHLRVTGMMCQKSCGSTVENALQALPGATHAQVSFEESYATVTARLEEYGHDNVEFAARVALMEDEAVDAIECVGFDAELISLELFDSYLESIQTLSLNEMSPSYTNTTQSVATTTDDDDEFMTVPLGGMNDCTASFQVGGMSCAICAGRVERALMGVEGVAHASVTLSMSRAHVQVTSSDQIQRMILIVDNCVQAVKQAGYECEVLHVTDHASASPEGVSLQENAAKMESARLMELRMWSRLLLVSCVLTAPLMYFHYGHDGGMDMERMSTSDEWIMFGFSTPVQFGVGWRYYKAAYKGWTNGRFMGMDFLVVMGTTASYVFSLVVFGLHLWTDQSSSLDPTFATGAMLLTFVTLGKFLEAYAKGKTASALQTLMELQPDFALCVLWEETGDDDEQLSSNVDMSSLETREILAADVCIGDHVLVLPGARIPVDGILVAASGLEPHQQHAYVDESALSGEPFPVAKRVGENLFGSSVNQLSALLIRVTATGGNTVLAKIVRLVEDAQSQKAPIQAQADRIACIFAPSVLCLSTFTFLVWLGLNNHVSSEQRFFWAFTSAISVIVVACPCALGLATPTAVMVGTGVGATHGLLIKGGAILESAHGVDTVIFDKTGTLTTGHAVLGDSVMFAMEELLHHLPTAVAKQPQHVALWLAACTEKQSEHPLGKAIVNAARSVWGADVTCSQDGVEVSEFRVVPGSGVECLVRRALWGEWRVRVGNRQFVNEPLVDDDSLQIDESLGDKEIKDMRQRGQVGIYVSVISEREFLQKIDLHGRIYQRRVIAVLGIVDPIESEARSTVAALRRMGVDVWMCTGDDEITALAVGRQVGIDEANVCAGVKPEGKADLVTRLQKRNRQRRSLRHLRRHEGGRVAMIGDGINDAIALARADVGIAIGAGTEVAVEAADIVLVRSSLHDVVVALHLSRVVFHRIRLNFVWALGYNLFALPFAAGALFPFMSWRLPPEFAGLMMAFSSVSVVTSSLLLRTYSKPVILEDGSFEQAPWLCSRLCDRMRVSCEHMTSRLRSGPTYNDVETEEYVDQDMEML